MRIKCRVIHKDAKVPKKYYGSDAGLDLYCCSSISIPPKEIRGVRTGVAIDVPDNHVGIMWARSSTCIKGLQCFAGLWDPGYVGEIVLNMYNFTEGEVIVRKHERFAQFIIVGLNKDIQIVEVSRLTNRNKRGKKGLGSSGL